MLACYYCLAASKYQLDICVFNWYLDRRLQRFLENWREVYASLTQRIVNLRRSRFETFTFNFYEDLNRNLRLDVAQQLVHFGKIRISVLCSSSALSVEHIVNLDKTFDRLTPDLQTFIKKNAMDPIDIIDISESLLPDMVCFFYR